MLNLITETQAEGLVILATALGVGPLALTYAVTERLTRNHDKAISAALLAYFLTIVGADIAGMVMQ